MKQRLPYYVLDFTYPDEPEMNPLACCDSLKAAQLAAERRIFRRSAAEAGPCIEWREDPEYPHRWMGYFDDEEMFVIHARYLLTLEDIAETPMGFNAIFWDSIKDEVKSDK